MLFPSLSSMQINGYWENSGEKNGNCDTNNKASVILQGILDPLSNGEKTDRTIPVGFYFALLSRSLELGLRSYSQVNLQDKIASMLHFAQVEDFLLLQIGTESCSSSKELVTMKSIFSTFASFSMDTNPTPSAINSTVAELWDTYLCQIASDPEMQPRKFMELVELLPKSSQQSDDQLYGAVNSFLQAHRDLTQEEKGSVCKYLNCQKLSQEACIEAIQNELMPPHLIVQALFVQQMNTHQASKECSDSFRFTEQFSRSLSSSRCHNSRSLNLGESQSKDGAETDSKPLSLLLQNDLAMERNYESTSFRLPNLVQELMPLKKSLQWHNMSKTTDSNPNRLQSMKPYGLESRSLSKRRNPLDQVTGRIGSVNFASQRKYASRIIKIFSRFSLFGIRKSKRKPGVSGLWTKSI